MSESIIKAGRRKGNTTRQVDLEVQLLFDFGEVQVADHGYKHGNGAHDHHLHILLKRLSFEHGLSLSNGLDYIQSKKVLRLTKPITI